MIAGTVPASAAAASDSPRSMQTKTVSRFTIPGER